MASSSLNHAAVLDGCPRGGIMHHSTQLVAAGIALAFVTAGSAFAAPVKLPKQLTWTAYPPGSTGHTQSVAIGNMLKNKYGISLEVLPGKNDISRMTPLRKGTADYCACGIAAYFGSEGVTGQFATKRWGPQKIRTVMASSLPFGLGIVTTKASNVKSYRDLKGKKLAWVRGGDALNVDATGILAFAGLTWNDVQKVEYGGWNAAVEGLIKGQNDGIVVATITSLAKKIAAGPRGIYWPNMDFNDAAGWARLKKVTPYYRKTKAILGASLSKEKPWYGVSYYYPILVTNADKPKADVYSLVKAMVEGYDDFKNNAPGTAGWAMSKQDFNWVLPFHDGAIAYYKERGVWSDAAQKHNDALVARQDTLAAAWRKFLAGGTPSGKAAFKAAWYKSRAASLRAAGMDPIFE